MELALIFWYFSNGLSCISTLYVLLTLLLFRLFHPKGSNYHHPTRNYYSMLFWLSTTSFITALYAFIAPLNGWCFTQGLIGHVCDLSISFWYALMAYELYVIIVYQEQRTANLLHRRWLFLCGGNWALSILFPLIAFFIHENELYIEEPKLEWCFISPQFPITIIIVYYIPQFIAWIFCCLYTIKILKYTRIMTPELSETVEVMNNGKLLPNEQPPLPTRHRSESVVRKSALESTQKRLVLYPSCFVFLFLTAFLDRLYQWITGEQNNILVLLHILCFPGEGLVNAMLFCSSHNKTLKIWGKLWYKLKSLCWLPCKYGYCLSIEDHPDDVNANSSVQLVMSSSHTPLLQEPNDTHNLSAASRARDGGVGESQNSQIDFPSPLKNGVNKQHNKDRDQNEDNSKGEGHSQGTHNSSVLSPKETQSTGFFFPTGRPRIDGES